MIRTILLSVSAACAAGLLCVNLYTSIVDAPNWGANIPESISTARSYYSVANPGHFFRIFSPLNQVLAVVALIICWKNYRTLAITSLAVAILLDVLTFGYFYPRNEIMFMAPMDETSIRAAWAEWSTMNWVRSAMCLVNTVLTFSILTAISKKIPS